MNLLDYFEVSLIWKEEKPKVKFKLKKEFILDKKPLFKKSGQPISGSQVEYYINYLGESLGKEIYEYRRKYFGLKQSLLFLFENSLLTEEEKIKCESYLKKLKEKTLKNHLEAINKKEYREKLKNVYNHESHSEIHKNLWRDSEYREKIISSINKPEVREKAVSKYKKWHKENKESFLLAMNNPERVNKIRKKTLERWQSKKTSEVIKIKNFVNSSRNKNYICNGIKMNSIEFLIAQTLIEFNISFEYEKVFNKNKKSYVPDFYLPEYNIVIECFGDYWHANPLFFKPDDIIKSAKIKAKDIWKKDENRKLFYEEQNICFYSFWEKEIKENLEEIKEKILTLKKNYE